jgi:hypothetical protein
LKISIFDPFPFMRGIVKRFAQANQARCAKERRLGQPSNLDRDGWEAVVPWLLR